MKFLEEIKSRNALKAMKELVEEGVFLDNGKTVKYADGFAEVLKKTRSLVSPDRINEWPEWLASVVKDGEAKKLKFADLKDKILIAMMLVTYLCYKNCEDPEKVKQIELYEDFEKINDKVMVLFAFHKATLGLKK